MLRTIKVYGVLAKKLGQKTFYASVNSVAEAVRFLIANFPDIEREIVKHNYRVTSGGMCVYDAYGVQTILQDPSDIITITPILQGSDRVKDAFVKVLTGIGLIAASFFVPFGAPFLFSVGASLVFGGIAQAIAPNPRNADLSDQNPKEGTSYSFSGVQNTTRQGVPVPIIYGEAVTGSVTISLGYDTTNLSDTVEGTPEEQGDT